MSRGLQLLMWILVLPVLVYIMVFYVVMPIAFPVKVGWQIDPLLQTSLRSHAFALYLHIIPSAIALGAGLLQFRKGKNSQRPSWHPLVGKLYLVAVLLGGLSGLYLAVWSFAGLLAQLGFALLSVAWLGTTWVAWRRILDGKVIAHKQWMLRSFALTLAGLTLRVLNQIWFAADFELAEFHAFNAWLCWVPNLVVVEAIIIGQRWRGLSGSHPTEQLSSGGV